MAKRIDNDVHRFVRAYTTKKGQFWSATVPDGFGAQIRRQGFLKKEDAVFFAKKTYVTALAQNKRIELGIKKQTFKQYVNDWLKQKARDGVSEGSVGNYRKLIDSVLIPFFGPICLQDLEKFHVRNFLKESSEKGLSSYQISRSVVLFKSIIRQAIEDDLMPMSGIMMMKAPKHKEKPPRFWDDKEMRFFLNAVSGNPNLNLFKFALYTGMRAGEIAGLKWECVHFQMKSGNHIGFIDVRRTWCAKTRTMKDTTKNGDRRMIPIFPEALSVLMDLKEKVEGEFVFGGSNPQDSSHFNRLLQSTLNKIPELKRINFHGLRHTFCSFIDSSGMPRRIVAEIMGHKDLSTTDRYSHVSNQTLGNEVSRWISDRNQQNSNKILEVAK